MRVALYHRVSTLDQNPELAREELRAAAHLRGGAVLLDVEETGSGAKNDRPGLARVMEAARAGRIDAVLCWKLDRFGRSALDLLANVRSLRDAGVRFVCTSQGLDFGDGAGAIGQLLLTVLAGVAEFERELIRERTRLGQAKAVKAGKRIGRERAAVAEGAAARARELFAGPGASWPQVRQVLVSEGLVLPFATGKHAGELPSVASVYRALTKTCPELRPAGPVKSRVRRPRGRLT